ncbi:protein kinase [bacterium]|nr:protein kinase [bacterium]
MKLGDYEILSELGRGGMGVVYHARAADGREVAIKVLPSASSDSAMIRFQREKELQRALGEEDGFVPLLDSGERMREPWLVMPLVGGGSLRDRLRRGPLAVDEAAALGRTLARALARAHARGIVHRDLKPENVLFTTRGRPLIADLGVAKRFDALTGQSGAASLSRSGAFVGTVGYLSPEQLADSKAVGPQADVFALGAILYECLAGKPAFVGESMIELCAKVASGVVEPLSRARPETPPPLARVGERALSPDPRARFASGEEIERAFAEAARAGDGSRGALRTVVLAALLGVVVAGSIVGGALLVVSQLNDARREEEQQAREQERRRKEAALRAEDERKQGEEKARKETRARAQALVDAARAEGQRGDFERAAGSCSKAIELDPGFAEAWAVRASSRVRLNDFDGAVVDATRAVGLDPRCAHAYEARATARTYKQDCKGAIEDFDRALAIEPRSVTAHVGRGNAHGVLGELEAAIGDYTRAIEADPGSAGAWGNRANCRALLGQQSLALGDYTKALEIDPRSANTWKNRGLAREGLGDTKGAIEDLEKALEIEPALGESGGVRAEIEKLKRR